MSYKIPVTCQLAIVCMGDNLMKKILLIIILIPIAMVIFDVPYYVDHFERNYHCIRFLVGDELYEEVDVRIEGDISKYLDNKDDVIRYKLNIDGVDYPSNKENWAIIPYKKASEDGRGIYSGGQLLFNPTTKIERALAYRDEFYEVRMDYHYFDLENLESHSIHDGFFHLRKDYKEICIGLFNDTYDPDEFPTGMTVIVSAGSVEEAHNKVYSFWKTLME